jgi:hypothetical protein
MIKYIFTCISILGAWAVAQPIEAAYLSAFTGNSQSIYGPPTLTPNPSSDGVTNFAVYNTVDADWTDDFAFGGPVTYGFGGPGAGNSSSYVYFYQAVNTNPLPLSEDALEAMQVELPGGVASITGAGFIPDTVFLDITPVAGGPTGPAGNARLGALLDVTAGDDVPGNGAPSEMLVASPGFASLGATEPLFITTGASSLSFDFISVAGGSTIPSGGWSSILFITSNNPPTYLPGSLQDFSSTNGDIPSPVAPEPSAFVLVWAGLMSFSAARHNRPRRKSLG